MKITGYILITCFAILSFTGEGTASDWNKVGKEEFDAVIKKVIETFDRQQYSLTVEYRSYKGYGESTPYESSSGRVIKKGDKYLSDLLGVTTIQNRKHRLVINEEEKMIYLRAPEEKSLGMEEVMSGFWRQESEILGKKVGGNRIYRIDPVIESRIDYYEMMVDSKGHLRNIIFYYSAEYPVDPERPESGKSKPKLEISYSQYNFTSTIPEHTFSINKYVSVDGKRIEPVTRYSNYSIQDLRIYHE